jgi:hypothetical protein
MARWLWKTAEILALLIFGAFVLVPYYLEKDFIKSLYSSRPVLCVGSLTACGLIFIAVIVHAIVNENRANKGKRISTSSST